VDQDLPDLGCDFLAAGTHKWLFGPRGYHTFEHRWALAEAFGFMAAIGRDRVVARTTEQATRLKEGLAGLPGIVLRTPLDPEVSAGIVCFEVEGTAPPEAVHRLRESAVVGSSTPYATSYVRLGPSIVTDPDDVDQAVEAVSSL
jgi:selenocysteine lyase/cysteine desulfurase